VNIPAGVVLTCVSTETCAAGALTSIVLPPEICNRSISPVVVPVMPVAGKTTTKLLEFLLVSTVPSGLTLYSIAAVKLLKKMAEPPVLLIFTALVRPMNVAVPSPLYVAMPLSVAVWLNTKAPNGISRSSPSNGSDETVHVLATVTAYAPRSCALRFASASATDATPVVIRAMPGTSANCATLTKFLMTHLPERGLNQRGTADGITKPISLLSTILPA
jgi:hypothetical protein